MSTSPRVCRLLRWELQDRYPLMCNREGPRALPNNQRFHRILPTPRMSSPLQAPVVVMRGRGRGGGKERGGIEERLTRWGGKGSVLRLPARPLANFRRGPLAVAALCRAAVLTGLHVPLEHTRAWTVCRAYICSGCPLQLMCAPLRQKHNTRVAASVLLAFNLLPSEHLMTRQRQGMEEFRGRLQVVTHNTRTTRSTRPFLDVPHLMSPFFLSTHLLCISKQVGIAHYSTLLCSCSVCRGPVGTVPLGATLQPPVKLVVLSQSPHFQKNHERRSKRQAKSDSHLSRRARKKWRGKISALNTYSGELLAHTGLIPSLPTAPPPAAAAAATHQVLLAPRLFLK